MPIQDVAVVRWVEGLTVAIGAGLSVIGKVLAADQTLPYTVPVGANVAALNVGIDIRGYTAFTLIVPANFDGSVINIEVNANGGTTWFPLYDITNAAVQVGSGVVAPGRAYDLPGELGGAAYVRFNCVTVQSTDPTIFSLMMKAA
jgi:hypothetical protein